MIWNLLQFQLNSNNLIFFIAFERDHCTQALWLYIGGIYRILKQNVLKLSEHASFNFKKKKKEKP